MWAKAQLDESKVQAELRERLRKFKIEPSAITIKTLTIVLNNIWIDWMDITGNDALDPVQVF